MRDQLRSIHANLGLCPLEEVEEFNTFYHSRHGLSSELDRMGMEVRLGKPRQVLFVSGHRGCGKSTELRMLGSRLEADFAVVFVVSGSGWATTRPGIEELLLVVLSEFLRHVDPGREVRRFLETLASALGQEPSESPAEDLDRFLATLRLGSIPRAEVRELLRPRISHLIGALSSAAENLTQASGKQPLLIIDDLDRLAPADAQELLLERASVWQALPLKVICTVPIPAFYSLDFMALWQSTTRLFVPPVTVRSYDGRPSAPGLDCLARVLEKRMPLDLFEPDGLHSILVASGGIIRSLLRLAAKCLVHVSCANRKAIDNAIANQVVMRQAREMVHLVGTDDLAILRHVSREKQLPSTEERVLQLVLIGLVLANSGDAGIWFDVHPAVQPLVGLSD